MTDTTERMQEGQAPTTFAEAEKVLAASLPDYEERPAQQQLAAAVETAFATGRHALTEAGCGTGKSFAYLIPAMLSGQRVVVATATKALQDQIANSDLPFLRAHLGINISAFVLKGRSNYLCQGQLTSPDVARWVDVAAINEILDRVADDDDFLGEQADFDSLGIEQRDWSRLVCPGKSDCPYDDECFFQVARRKAREARVVIVNHALLATDLVLQSETEFGVQLLGGFDKVVLDESHEFAEWVTKQLESQISEGSLNALDAEVTNFVQRIPAHATHEVARRALKSALGAQKVLWDTLEPESPRENTWRIREGHVIANEDAWVDMAEALAELAVAVREISLEKIPPAKPGSLKAGEKSPYQIAQVRRDALAERAGSLSARFREILLGSWTDIVRWVEIDNDNERFGPRKILKTAPVSVAPFLRQFLFNRATEIERINRRTGEAYTVEIPHCTVVATSATASVNGKFDFQANQLGVDDYAELEVGSPFDFEVQARLYVPRLPHPSKEKAAWSQLSIHQMGELLRASEGRALVLFTSNAERDKAYDELAPTIPFNCLKQGQRPNKVLAEMFESDTHSILFATKSFFTGVDFKGETCSLVIINKMPFPVPTEPMFQAQAELVKQAGKSDFAELSMPAMILVLKQAFGRLIRHRSDKGVVAILDSRLLEGWGKKVQRALPPAKLTESYAEAASFFEGAA